MEAAGISSRQLVRPVLAFAAVMTLAGLLLALYLSPWATRSLENILTADGSGEPRPLAAGGHCA